MYTSIVYLVNLDCFEATICQNYYVMLAFYSLNLYLHLFYLQFSSGFLLYKYSGGSRITLRIPYSSVFLYN